MKIYKCDTCKDEFDAEDGMVSGRYTHERKIQFRELAPYPSHGTVVKIHKVRKTLKLYDELKEIDPQHAAKEVVVNKDLCPACVKKLEKP